MCQANIVAGENADNASHGLQVYGATNGAVKPVLQWMFSPNVNSTLPEGKTPYGENQAPASVSVLAMSPAISAFNGIHLDTPLYESF